MDVPTPALDLLLDMLAPCTTASARTGQVTPPAAN
jgi:hypothetical protein